MIEKVTVQITTQREIPLGYQGENDARRVVFVVEPLGENWMLLHQRPPDNDPYPVPLDVTDRGLVWRVTGGDTAYNGTGRAQLICSGPEGEILKTCTYKTKIAPALPVGGEVPDPVKPWYDSIMEAIEQGGSGVSLGITGAAVGQIAKIAAVDENGVPTAWEAVDMPEGGGGDEPAGSFSVTWNLSNVSSSSNVSSVSAGAALVAVLTPAAGYTLGDVTVTMGGTALSGVWDADTSTVTIVGVTGDVVISCAGVKILQVDTSPVIVENDKGLGANMGINSLPGVCYTKTYLFTPDVEAIHASSYYDAENDWATMAGAFVRINVVTPSVKMREAGYSTVGMTTGASKIWWYRDGTPVEYSSNSYLISAEPDGTPVVIQPGRHNTDLLYTNGMAFSLSMLDAEDSYAYWGRPQSGVYPIGVREGDIIFAGKNTPYYGMANIDGTLPGQSVQALSVDQDIAMDYSVSTPSVLGSTPVADSDTAYGVSPALANLITEAKNAWMTEYGGDCRKIPLIITTDQHGRTNPGLFCLLGKTLSMHDVSKICNLGDTVAEEWKDEDPAHPLLSCAQLEGWCESVKEIPFSKQLNVFGNHDTWYGNYADEGNPIGTRYPASQAHLNQYFRNIYARRINNNGWFSVKDDQFNVKYVVISGFEYQGGSGTRISTTQMTWLISELSEKDGYDIVLMSHIPLHFVASEMHYPNVDEPSGSGDYRVSDVDTDELFAARKDRGSGTVTDSEGVDHDFDFSESTGQLLCALHGHTHYDAYNYVGSVGVLSMAFDWFDDNTLHFVLIDRSTNKLNVWKVEGDALKTTNYQVQMDGTTI